MTYLLLFSSLVLSAFSDIADEPNDAILESYIIENYSVILEPTCNLKAIGWDPQEELKSGLSQLAEANSPSEIGDATLGRCELNLG